MLSPLLKKNYKKLFSLLPAKATKFGPKANKVIIQIYICCQNGAVSSVNWKLSYTSLGMWYVVVLVFEEVGGDGW